MVDGSDSAVSTLRGLWPVIRPFRWLMVLGLAMAGGLTVVGMLPPLLMRPLINDVAGAGQWGLLPLLIGGLFAITVLRAVMTYVNARTVAFVGQRIVGRVRTKLFHHMLHLPMRYHERTSVGGLMQRLMGDVGAIQNLVTGHIITLCVDLITAVFALTVLFGLNWKLALFTIALMPVFYLNYRFWIGRIKLNNVQMRSEMDHVSSLLQERLASHDLVASYAQEDESLIHFRDRARASRDTAIRGVVYNLGFNHVSQFANAAGNTLIFVGAVYFYIEGAMDYGDVIAFAAYASMLLGPVVRFVQILQATTHSLVNIRRVNEVFTQPTDPVGGPELARPRTIEGQVAFDGYTYRDPDTDALVLDHLDLDVPAGMNLTLVGPPSSGKSTMLAAVRRMIEPTEGRVFIDGTDVREISPLVYRRAAPVVRETTGVFRGTIRSNLAYGKSGASDEQMHEALCIVGLDAFVTALPQGLDTPIGAGGIRLSSGQRQRLGIARALVARPAMLILDEATAALDAASAAELLAALVKHLPHTTILSVARRIGESGPNDLIAVIEGGRIVESGTHAELMGEPDSRYRQLYELQFGATALAASDGDADADPNPEAPA